MGRQPKLRLLYKKNELIGKIPDSQCQKIGGGVITQAKVEEECEKINFY